MALVWTRLHCHNRLANRADVMGCGWSFAPTLVPCLSEWWLRVDPGVQEKQGRIPVPPELSSAGCMDAYPDHFNGAARQVGHAQHTLGQTPWRRRCPRMVLPPRGGPTSTLLPTCLVPFPCCPSPWPKCSPNPTPSFSSPQHS